MPRDPGDGGITLRDLIARIVRAEVAAFRERQDARRFLRALTRREMERGAAAGRIDPGGHEIADVVDPDEAVDTALQAFEDGLYLVVLDGEEQRELDRQVFIHDASRVVFLRLTFLAGG